MAIITGIQWCDSTHNLQMGCEGCELVKGQEFPRCYAKVMTDRYGGRNKGFPAVFEQPKIFPERLQKMLKWPDLTGTDRPDKPWLSGLPRVIFLNDMGDTFSKGMPDDWFAAFLPALAASPHIYMLLTKWPKRMAKFSKKHPFPANVWVGTTVTSEKTKFRAYELNNEVEAAGVKWLSVEPMWGPIEWSTYNTRDIELFIYGGESGKRALPFNISWMKDQISFCRHFNKRCFIKQLGSNARELVFKLDLKDFHGGDMEEWPDWLRLRQMPKVKEDCLIV